MNNIAIIPARSGSRGLPGKNIKPLCGKPLLAYSIQAAEQSGLFDTIHVSTDSEQYAAIARSFGADVPFLRSVETASDTASTWDAVLEVLEKYLNQGKQFDTVAVLQPTTPLRIAEDIRNSYQTLHEKDAKTVVSVCECEHSPLWSNTLGDNLCMDGFLSTENMKRRQDYRTFYRLNGAIYILTTDSLLREKSIVYDAECFASIMPAKRSIDIDTELDFVIAEAIMSFGQRSEQGGSL